MVDWFNHFGKTPDYGESTVMSSGLIGLTKSSITLADWSAHSVGLD